MLSAYLIIFSNLLFPNLLNIYRLLVMQIKVCVIAIPKESFLVIQRLLVPRSPGISKSEDAQAS